MKGASFVRLRPSHLPHIKSFPHIQLPSTSEIHGSPLQDLQALHAQLQQTLTLVNAKLNSASHPSGNFFDTVKSTSRGVSSPKVTPELSDSPTSARSPSITPLTEFP
eukprot:TRINITY_DN7122_c0_g1_i4.p1 TRINITY_DN7122_c0_g1~~TRINITY_DN7122_c0_g1_i4.p1  ORF type:complete len:107 (-),score=17.37 TRINITY_DN7122_c0_g1_i4:267-587(-)